MSTVMSTLETELMAAVAPLQLTPPEAKAAESAVALLSSKSGLDKLHNDVKIYIEACIARNNLEGKVVMLVTDDHTFFRAFAKSSIAENILLTQVEALVKAARKRVDKSSVEATTRPPLRVRLAGEIIPGM